MANTRRAHWIKLNHQCRIPKRWIAFDTESRVTVKDGIERQDWRIATAKKWGYDKWGVVGAEGKRFSDPVKLWEWVTDHCRPETRTVIVAHNIGHDIRIS